ncbi:hypothetical protein BCR39DRAFT_545167 [Naematelia encephala]|uniref:ChrR-like cupin domain-containing protein n=1 Tax=Naematelia encephala TaxID=71784 RepID=A0A1Y2AR72_9TREE|nr:hypothetical protein BCR39DRAFT_545167 [Naematelia encephala]
MPKPELEFVDVQTHFKWERNKEGSSQQVLAYDADTGNITKIVTRDPGHEQFTPVQVHDFWEEVYIMDGALFDKGLNKWFRAGMYTCRPPGMLHGPYKACPHQGAKMFVTLTYPPGTKAAGSDNA